MTKLLKWAFWLILVLALGVYLIMLVWTLPAISGAAGGLAPFDMRPGGYDYAAAREFLSALPEDANSFYRHTQLGVLDMAFPALIGAALFLAIGLLGQIWLRLWAWLLALVAIPGAVFDYMENANIRLMLFLGPDNITPEIVARASARSVTKAQFTTLAMSVLLVLLIVWAVLWLRNRKTATEAQK